jgi:hypothetical protein
VSKNYRVRKSASRVHSIKRDMFCRVKTCRGWPARALSYLHDGPRTRGLQYKQSPRSAVDLLKPGPALRGCRDAAHNSRACPPLRDQAGSNDPAANHFASTGTASGRAAEPPALRLQPSLSLSPLQRIEAFSTREAPNEAVIAMAMDRRRRRSTGRTAMTHVSDLLKLGHNVLVRANAAALEAECVRTGPATPDLGAS